jgi:hypothetical protein
MGAAIVDSRCAWGMVMEAVADCTEPALRLRALQKVRPTSQSWCHPVRSLANGALETFLRSTPGADDIIRGSVMSLGVERFMPTNRTL